MMYSVRPSEETIRRYRASGQWRAETVVEDVFRWAGQTPGAPAVVAFSERGGLAALTYRYLSGLGMTDWYWPTRVERVTTLPRNHMGKVEKEMITRNGFVFHVTSPGFASGRA